MKRICLIKRNRILHVLAVILPLLAMLIVSTPVLAAPVIILSPTSGAIGTRLTVTGTNFESYRGDNVLIYFDDEEIAGNPVAVPQAGSFSTDFNIPDDATPGRHWIRIKSEDTGSTLASSLFIILQSEIRLNIVEGTINTMTTVTGKGFYAGRMVTFYYSRIGEKLGTQAASSTGEFSYSFTIPSSTAGKHKIRAENAEGDLAEAEFEVIPSIALNLSSGAPGDLFTVSGTGFGYRSIISIYFGNDEIASAKTDGYGNFQVTFNTPELKPSNYDVKVVDEDDNVDRAKFSITAGISLDKASGSVGKGLTVKGSGFSPSGTAIVTYDDIHVATAIADNNGAFSGTFNIPVSTSGEHLITVSDGAITKQLIFTVEATPPPSPALLLPIDVSEAKSEAYFDWESVTDPSLPVSYSLQVASDANFASIVLVKQGLIESEYILAEEERLPSVKKEAPYYWRMKAIDSASNESEWSLPTSFYVAAPPAPALLLPEVDSKAEALAYFYWESVTDLSPPITYHLQIASDENFTSIVLEKQGLADHKYAIAEDEKLEAVRKEAPYYWRVKAVDSASNESEWSSPSSFYVGFSFALPGWLLYTLIGLGVIFIGFLAFWVGRRTAYYQTQSE